MLNIFITLLTFILVITSFFMMLTILMQRPNSNAGMGAAFGGGITESTFGTETTNILTRATRYAAITFFLVSISLFMLHIKKTSLEKKEENLVTPQISADASAPAVEVETPETPAVDSNQAATPTAEQVIDEASQDLPAPAASESSK